MPIYAEFYKGENKSKYEQSGFDATDNLDVHSEIGTAKAQLALASESSTPNENCISETLPNGDVFFASTESGKIWKRAASNNAYSLVHTNTNGANKGIKYFDGNLYYVAANKLGKQAEGLASSESSWSSQDDSFGTLSTTPTYAPMFVLNLTLWIGAGAFVDEVDSSGTFAAAALDLPAGYSVTTLNSSGSDLAIGTIRGTGVSHSRIFIWDTYSPSWTVEDDVDEIGINAFIRADNVLFAQCGTSGEIYYWNGGSLQKFGRIRGVTTAATGAHYKTTAIDGKPLLGIGSDIYSIYREYNDLPNAFVHEYTVTTGSVQSLGYADGTLLVSNGTNIDALDTNRATATITTPISESKAKNVIVRYERLPSGSSIGIGTKVDGASSFTSQTTKTDTVKKQVYFDGGLGDVNFIQAQITLTPNGANTPVIRSIEII